MSLFKRKKPEEKLSFKIKMAEKMVRNRLRYATERDGDTDSVIGKNGGDREMYCVGDTRLLAKNRYGIPAGPLPFTWDALVTALKSGSGANGGS